MEEGSFLNTINLPATYIYANPPGPDLFASGGGGINMFSGVQPIIVDPFGPETPGNQHAYNMLIYTFDTELKHIRQAHESNMRSLATALNGEVEGVARQSPGYHGDLAQHLATKIAAVQQLIAAKNAELAVSEAKANNVFSEGEQRIAEDFWRRMEQAFPRQGQQGFAAWRESAIEYHKVRWLWEARNSLTNTLHTLQASLNQEQARVHQEQQRRAAEQQRLAAEHERQRVAQAQAAAAAAEQQERLLAAMEAKRAAQAALEQQAAEREQQRLAQQQAIQEQERLAAEQRALLTAQAQRAAQEEQRQAAEREAQSLAEKEASVGPGSEVPVSGLPGNLVPLRPIYGTFGAATIGRGAAAAVVAKTPYLSTVASRSVVALRNAVESFIHSARQFTQATASQVAKVFASLFIPSQLDNSDFYASSVPAAEVLPGFNEEVQAIAVINGYVELPGWAGLLKNTDTTSPDMTPVASVGAARVDVREALLDPTSNAYSVTLPNNSSITLTWLPIAPASDSSTALPPHLPETQPYTGYTLDPLEIAALGPPVAPPGLHGLITVFPADSGLRPIFTVYSSPYEDATTTGEYSGRAYNPDSAGGPIQDLDWQDAEVTQAGIDLVKLHIGRLDYSAGNDVMINRLEKILAGELMITDTDKRYYTHEIRELERYRNIGMADGPISEELKKTVWNNAHTATLEDYKLADKEVLLYTVEALGEVEKSDNEYYKSYIRKLLK